MGTYAIDDDDPMSAAAIDAVCIECKCELTRRVEELEQQLAEAREAVEGLVWSHGAAHQSVDLLERRLKAEFECGTPNGVRSIKALLAGRKYLDTARKADG